MKFQISIFYRKENKNFKPENIFGETLEVDCGADLNSILDYIYQNGLASKGSSRSGIFEVQTDAGFWKQVDEKKIDLSTPRRASKTVFVTWEQWEEELLQA